MDKSVTMNRIRGLLSLAADYIKNDELSMAMAAQALIGDLMIEEDISGEDVQVLLVVNDEAGEPISTNDEVMTDLRSRVASFVKEIEGASGRVSVKQ